MDALHRVNWKDGVSVAVGTGAPCGRHHARSEKSCAEYIDLLRSRGVAPLLPEMPISVGDSRTSIAGSWPAAWCRSWKPVPGHCRLHLSRGAQMDMYGNMNSTQIGLDHDKPKIRLPGSGGANDFASLCWRTMVVTVQDPRRFVEKCDRSPPPAG